MWKFPGFEPERGRHGEPGGDGCGRWGDEGARRGLSDPHQPRLGKIGARWQVTLFRQKNPFPSKYGFRFTSKENHKSLKSTVMYTKSRLEKIMGSAADFVKNKFCDSGDIIESSIVLRRRMRTGCNLDVSMTENIWSQLVTLMMEKMMMWFLMKSELTPFRNPECATSII